MVFVSNLVVFGIRLLTLQWFFFQVIALIHNSYVVFFSYYLLVELFFKFRVSIIALLF